MLNAALSISYGNIGGYGGQGIYGGPGIYPGGGQVVGGEGLLPNIQEDVPPDDKKREKPGDPAPTASSSPAKRVKTPETVRKEFIASHNNRVDQFNQSFNKKISTSRTGRKEKPDQVT